MSDTDLPTGFQLTELDPEFRADPYPRLAEVQRRCPVMHVEQLGSVMFTRYDDVKSIVNDRSLWRHPARAKDSLFARNMVARQEAKGAQDGPPPAESILFMDDPDHGRVRGPLTQAFYKRASKMRPGTEAIVGEVLDGLAGKASFDIIVDYGVPVPILVIAAVLGIPKERMREFRAWSEGISHFFNFLRSPEQEAELVAASQAITAYFEELMAARRAEPQDDLITDMVQLKDGGAEITDAEINVNLQSLLVGGNLTTTDLIGNGVRALLAHPDQLAKLRAEPGLIASTVEEILRYDPPISMTGRVSSRDMEIGGSAIEERESLMSSLRAANRDPEKFDDPNRFDIARKGTPHVAFGGGSHICIGAPLARMEGQVALAKLFERFPLLRLAEQQLTYRTLPGFRGLEKLIVET